MAEQQMASSESMESESAVEVTERSESFEKESMQISEIDPPFQAVASTYDEVKEIIRNYEIEHTVHFSCFTGATRFNAGIERWKQADGSSNSPRLMWGSQYVPHTGRPYIKVGKKHMGCQYAGKQRMKPDKTNNPSFTMRIGCPSYVHIAEVERLIHPVIKHIDGHSTRNQKTTFADLFRANVRRHLSGLPHELVFKREFHVTISPLSTHNHAIGEAAGPHEKVDPILRSRIQEIAASGVVATDLIRDDLERFVENLFDGKKPPLKTNRRFYPTVKDIRNHVEKAKVLENFNRSLPNDEPMSEDAVATSHIEGVTYHHSEETVEVDRYESVELIEQEGYHDVVQYFTDYSPNNSDKYVDVSSFSTVTTTKTTPRKSKSHSKTTETTTKLHKGRTRTAKEKSLSLVKKLYKIVNAVDSDNTEDMNKLMAALVDVMMVAKPLVPKDKVGVIFEDEPRPLAGPRRIRPKKRKPPVPLKQKHPDINPNALSWSDIKAKQNAERKKNREVKAAIEAARRAQKKARAEAAMEKRKQYLIAALGSDVVPVKAVHATPMAASHGTRVTAPHGTPLTALHGAPVTSSTVAQRTSSTVVSHVSQAKTSSLEPVAADFSESPLEPPETKQGETSAFAPRLVVLQTKDTEANSHVNQFFVTETVVMPSNVANSSSTILHNAPTLPLMATNSQTFANILPKAKIQPAPVFANTSAVTVKPLSTVDSDKLQKSASSGNLSSSTTSVVPSAVSIASKNVIEAIASASPEKQIISRSGRIIKRKVVDSL
ncbi:uncharacterized protein [Watersipora subatra]|uniref:uncharacterized protein n=1 Tax=Watersipora subatra TaxID=2589382 RepID=UPI00355ADBEA